VVSGPGSTSDEMTGLLGITESEHLESILSLRDLTLASELAKTACLGDSDGSIDDIVSPKIELDIDAEAIAQQDDELRQQFDKMRAGMLDSLPREVRDESLQASRDDALSQLSSIRTDSAASEVSSPPPRPDFPAMYGGFRPRRADAGDDQPRRRGGGLSIRHGRLRRGSSVILSPPFSFTWIIPIGATHESGE
jgi:hypothetical protein